MIPPERIDDVVLIDPADAQYSVDFNIAIPLLDEPGEAEAAERREAVIAASRAKYARPRTEIEAALRQMIATEPPAEKAAPKAKVVEKETQPPQPKIETPATPVIAPEPAKVNAQASSPIVATQVETLTPQPGAPVTALHEPKPVTVSEKKTATADLGKGGAQHKLIQQRIKEAAEALGFRSTIEKQIEGRKQSVDLLLQRGAQIIACEISLSTTIDHEVGNVAKCLKAGFTHVAVICLDTSRLEAIAVAVSGSLGPDAAKQVSYGLPEHFIADLRLMPPPAAPEAPNPTVTTSKGYRVKRSYLKLTSEEQQQREDAANRVAREVLRRKPR